MFDLKDPAGILLEIDACRKTFPNHYVRVTAFDATRGWETPRMSFIVNRPAHEPGFRLRGRRWTGAPSGTRSNAAGRRERRIVAGEGST